MPPSDKIRLRIFSRALLHLTIGRPLRLLNIGPRLTLCFLLIMLAFLLGSGVLIWQFQDARVQAARLSGVDQELLTVLQAHTSLMSFYERLDAFAHSQNTAALATEVDALRGALLQNSAHTRNALSNLPPEVQPDPALLPTLLTIQGTLPAELEAIAVLARSRDWEAVRLRLANQIQPLESRSAALVGNIDREVEDARTQAISNIARVQRRILVIVPITAVLTLLYATILGMGITRSITRPLGRLMDGTAALSKGDFDHRVPASGKDEIARLGNVFNNMTVKLQDLYHEIATREMYLAEAQKLSRTGSFGWDVGTGQIFWSEETFRIFELDPNSEVTVSRIVDRTHPEDRTKLKHVMEAASRERMDFRVEHRLSMPDGSVKHLLVVGHPNTADSKHVQFVGAVTDISERKRAEEALRRSEGYLAEAQRMTRSGSWAWNIRTNEVFWSREMFRIFGYDAETTKPTMSLFLERVHQEDRPLLEERARQESTQKQIGDSEGDFRIVLPDGTTKHLHSIAHPVVKASGEILEVVGTTMDVTEQQQSRVALETAFEEIKTLRDQLYKENIALREEIDRSSMFEEIVGESPALQSVLARVAKVAPTNSTVLISGETGTGKELIARAIHKRSTRAARAFISVNCAAIPASLIASELFGHEKGAFTGAIQRRLGRFELAEGGTIFLDEIGELSLEMQVALLRVLQEHEFERVGGTKVIKTDVRVIAASNRDLPAAIAAGTFRSDLFYRLNVFPMEVPPLRKRREDIPLLVEYFTDRYSKKAGKKIRAINSTTLERLKLYAWPGNIRELQNIIERSVILCETDTLTVEEGMLSGQRADTGDDEAERPVFRMPPEEERKAIEAALAEARGRVSGPDGAAAKLGIPASTLDSKIRALGINKYRFKAI